MQSKRVAILGRGRYGRFLEDFLKKRGCEVRSSDVDGGPSNQELVIWAEVVIVAVTLAKTVTVIQSITPLLKPEQIIIDIASTKKFSVDAMLKTQAEVLGLHPFCAPPVKRGTFRGQTIFVHFSRVLKWAEWVSELLRETEAVLEVTTPDEHDLERTVDQCLEHLCSNLKVAVMRSLGLDPSKLFRIASPVYALTAVQMARMFAQDGCLYGALPMTNPFMFRTLQMFKQELKRFQIQVERADMRAYCADFTENATYLGRETIQASFALSEHLTALMADLKEPNSMRLVTPRDEVGILERVGACFKDAGISIVAFHSRRMSGCVEFFIAFEEDTRSPVILDIKRRLAEELGARFE